ncbi:hypothetical protein [Pseudotamlana carrageenivorans]|uniref:Alginate lyase 2 domain-containing protein n=1 Tax=Pseudotamlana carrageenivorans TaxID=2069432 RepID=A0A2I7SK69_9FLAO|nr:hypothetical protein [Tamlana carrageenivorans]AUS06292.1 hypothetical protein C1A40_12925 [Tamlana carrageenivorans]
MQNLLQIIAKSRLILYLALFFSCSTHSENETDKEKTMVEEQKLENSNSTTIQDCDEVSDFPNLGPSASQSQTCDDIANPNNKGTLDCRTDNAFGGYQNLDNIWGSYKITGSEIRYEGTRTRVERFFKTILHDTNKKTILTGTLKIIDLSDGNTCIIQSHAGGDIIKGEEAGRANRSAQFLLYAKKSSNNKIQLETHVTINPYTTDTGGSRDVKNFKTLNYNQEYTFIYETGYDATGTAFSKIKIGDTETYFTHNHTTERVYTRYGAYGTGDSGDVTAHVAFKDVNLCRTQE